MDISRRGFGLVVAGIYATGGVLLLGDALANPSSPEAWQALAWHTTPVFLIFWGLAASVGAEAVAWDCWSASRAAGVLSYGVMLCVCTLILLRVVGGPARSS